MATEELAFSAFFKVLVVAPDETHFRVVSRALQELGNLDIVWSDDKIRGLAELLIQKPRLLIVAFPGNSDSLEFVKLVRNNPTFQELPVFVVFHQPVKLGHKLRGGLNIAARFTTVIDQKRMQQEVKKLIKAM